MVLPSWMEWNTPEGPSATTITPTICTIQLPETPSFGVVGQGLTDQAKLTHPRLSGLVSDSGRIWGRAGKQPVKCDTPPRSFDPCAPSGFDKFPPPEGAVT
jgi:hypothetical protein